MDVFSTDEYGEWFTALSESDQDAADRVVGLLADQGINLGFPYCSAIAGASFALRELRVQSMGRPLRIFYAFDPRRDGLLILGGDKTGDDRFYETMIPACERIWNDYLKEQVAGLHGKD